MRSLEWGYVTSVDPALITRIWKTEWFFPHRWKRFFLPIWKKERLVYTSHGNPVPGQKIQRPVPANLVQELAPRLAYAESRNAAKTHCLPSPHLSPLPPPLCAASFTSILGFSEGRERRTKLLYEVTRFFCSFFPVNNSDVRIYIYIYSITRIYLRILLFSSFRIEYIYIYIRVSYT